MYIDFGTIEEKEISDLCYLIDEPAYTLAPMAVEASLYNLKPPNCDAEYSLKSIQKFADLIDTDLLIAKNKTEDGQVCKIIIQQN